MRTDSKQLAARLPGVGKTPHLPHRPNLSAGDTVADPKELDFLRYETVGVEEKVDGASAAIMLGDDGEFIIRNKDHVLKKGYVKKETPAKLQFRPIWNWAVENRKAFQAINRALGRPVGLYGEWCWAVHGIVYTRLPSPFMIWDVYDPDAGRFLSDCRVLIETVGLHHVPVLHEGPVTLDELDNLRNGPSRLTDGPLEGVVVKVSQHGFQSHKFKLVREGYKQGALWDPEKLTRQKVL